MGGLNTQFFSLAIFLGESNSLLKTIIYSRTNENRRLRLSAIIIAFMIFTREDEMALNYSSDNHYTILLKVKIGLFVLAKASAEKKLSFSVKIFIAPITLRHNLKGIIWKFA